jgi:cytochrome c556
MKRTLSVALIVAIGGGVALAQQDPIAARRALMKSNGEATAAANKMAKGETPFDIAKVRDVYQVYTDVAAKMHSYFPANSKTGGDTIASPKIWENMADFEARFVAWGKDIEKAKLDTKDLDTFKAQFANLTKACASCHENYRLKRS